MDHATAHNHQLHATCHLLNPPPSMLAHCVLHLRSVATTSPACAPPAPAWPTAWSGCWAPSSSRGGHTTAWPSPSSVTWVRAATWWPSASRIPPCLGAARLTLPRSSSPSSSSLESETPPIILFQYCGLWMASALCCKGMPASWLACFVDSITHAFIIAFVIHPLLSVLCLCCVLGTRCGGRAGD